MTSVTPNLLGELRAALHRRPFTPFAIVTRDGKKHRVMRLFQAGTNGQDVAIISKDDRMTWLKIQDIVGIEPIVWRWWWGGRRGKS